MPITKIRSGVSLLELLVVLAVIGILIALIIPAVQASRRSARSMKCKDNLRQLGIAVANFEAAKQHWPERFLDLLPYCEHGTSYGLIKDWEAQAFESGTTSKFPPVSNVEIFECPDDRGFPNHQAGLVSYHFNDGTTTQRYGDRTADGIVGRDVKLGPSSVVDGLSQTAMISERLIFSGLSNSTSPPIPSQRSAWPLANGAETPDELVSAYNSTNWQWKPKSTFRSAALGADRCYYFETRYEHVLTPNSRPVYSFTNPSYSSTRPATSQHDAGVHVAFCDGSVSIVSNDVELSVWRALGTRRGGEVVSDF